jgi:stage II sporulation protein M
LLNRIKSLFQEGSFSRWLAASVLIFAVGIIAGVLPLEGLRSLLTPQLLGLEELANQNPPFAFSTFLFILAKNALSLVASFALSPLLEVVPLATLLVNGWLLGFIAELASRKVGFLLVLLGILPHGIFELSAFFIGEAAALSFGAAAIDAVFNPEKRPALATNLSVNFKRLLFAVALLVPAAIVETYVTPLFIV